MRKFTLFLVLIIVIMLGFIIIFNKASYSFFKELLIKRSNKSPEKIIMDKNIDGIEDLIFIPDIKNFKKYFLRRLNNNYLIVVRIPENILYFYKYNHIKKEQILLKQFPVTVGRLTRQTPIGEGIVYTKGHIFFKHIYGTNAGRVIEKGHTEDDEEFDIPYEKMFGLYMVINQSDAYVIHSTTEDWKIGSAASSGCVRMLIPDMLALYPYIRPPIKVIIKYELFKLENGMLTVFPDIYRRHYSLYSALMEFFRNENINTIIFDTEKIKKVLFRPLPVTISLNEILHDYFISRRLSYEQIHIKYKDILQGEKIAKINDFFIHNK